MKKSFFILVIVIQILTSCSTPNTQLPAASSTPTRVPSTATITPTFSPTPIPLPPVISAANVMNLQEDFSIGKGRVSDAVWMPDGNVALVYPMGISIYNSDTGTFIKSVEPSIGTSRYSIISPDGKRVAALMYENNKVVIWDANTGKIERELETGCQLHYFSYQVIAFNGDGSKLAACSEEGVSLWNLTNGDMIYTLKLKRKDFLSMTFNSTNDNLATSSYSNGYTDTLIWDTTTGEMIEKLPQIKSFTVNLRFSHQGNLLAWIKPEFINTNTSIYNITTNQTLQTIYDYRVAVFEFSPDDTTLILGGIYGWGTRLFDIAAGKFVTELNNNSANLIKYSEDGQRFVAGWGDFSVFRKIGDAQSIHLASFSKYSQVQFDPNGRYIAVGGDDTPVSLWDMQNKEQVFDHIMANGSNFLFTPSGDGIVTNAWANGTWQEALQEWDLSSKNQEFFGDMTTVWNRFQMPPPLLSPTGDLLVLRGRKPWSDPLIGFWDAHSKEFIFEIPISGLIDYKFSPDGKIFASAGEKPTIDFWDLGSRKVVRQIKCPANIAAFAFSPDGVSIAAAAANGVYIWDTNSGELVSEFNDLKDLPHKSKTKYPLRQVVFNPQGNILAAIGYDKDAHKTLFVWDLARNELMYRITGDEDPSAGSAGHVGLLFSPGGSFIVTSGLKRLDNTEFIQFWDTSSGQLIKTLDYAVGFNDYSPYLNRFSFSPDGRIFAVADIDGIVHILQVPASMDNGKEDIPPTPIPTAQLPPLPTTTPKPAPAWDFDKNDDLEGWQAQNQLDSLQTRNESLITKSTGNDPFMVSPTISVDSAAYSHIEIRMKVSDGNTAGIYFSTNSESGHDETKAVHFPITGDGQFHTYILDMSKVKKWSGKITQIRFDPTNAQADIEIDYIHILSSAMPTISPAWDFNQNGDSEGWKAQNQFDPLQISAGSLFTKSTGSDPFMVSSAIRLDASAFSHIEIRMKISAGNTADIYFITNSESRYDESKVLHFPLSGVGQFQIYILDMSKVKKWSGEITQIRFDPTNAQADIEIDYIHILP